MTGRRVHERYDCDLEVTLHVESVDGTPDESAREAAAGLVGTDVVMRTLNVSLGGMYLLTEAQIPYGAQVKVRFRLPALTEDTLCDGTIRWTKPDGVGVQFGSLRAIEVWALNQLFKTLSASEAG